MRQANQYLSPKTRLCAYVWSKNIENIIKENVKGVSLHLCSGRSGLGDVRLDKIIWKKYKPYYSKANMLGHADHIPFKDNSFDVVITDPEYITLTPPFIKEIIRVLKSGGKLIYYYPAVPYHILSEVANKFL